MANNYNFPPANFPAQNCQPGHWGAYLLGAWQTPPPPTQQELTVAWANCLLDRGQLRHDEEESSSDDDNIDPQLRRQSQPNMAHALQPQGPQATQAAGQCFPLFCEI